MDRTAFFAALRAGPMFKGRLTQAQVTGIEGLLDAFLTHGDGKDDTLAYGLATAYHETGARMVPVREGFATTDAGARRAVNKLAAQRGAGSAVARYARPAGPHGHVYYGRGHVQLTWLENYRSAGPVAQHDLVSDPDKMLDPVVSARVLWTGILSGQWSATGHGLRHWLDKGDVIGARRTVNGTDKAGQIAGYHARFLEAVTAAGGWRQTTAPRTPEAMQVTNPSSPARRSWWAALLAILRGTP